MPLLYCSACGESAFIGGKKPDSEILVVESTPNILRGIPTIASAFDNPSEMEIFRNEIFRFGIHLQELEIISLYPHISESVIDVENPCVTAMKQYVEELDLTRKKKIICFGDLASYVFANEKSSRICGIVNFPNKFKSQADIVFLPSLSTVYSSGIGEIRLGLKKLFSVGVV